MHSATDLSKDQIYRVFDMLDVDNSGLLDFDEFYLLVCILLAVRVRFHKVAFIIQLTQHSTYLFTHNYRTNRRRSLSSVTPGLCLSYWMKMAAMISLLRSLRVLDSCSTSTAVQSDRYSESLMFQEIK